MHFSKILAVAAALIDTSIGAIPSSCSGVSAAKYSYKLASGWSAVKVAGGLTAPRGIIRDTANRLLVVQSGKGITQHTLSSTGCINSTRTLISQTSLNHGIYLSPSGTTLYASSSTTVWSWTYDPSTGNVGSTATTLVTGMYSGGHVTRTLIIPKNNPNLLVVSHGSNGNLDTFAGQSRAVVKVFNLSSVPSGGYNFASGGYLAGYGLRNEVGLAFDNNNMLWGVENSADSLTRTANGQTTDVHNDNPAEELNYLGDVSKANTQWYGYPTCFTVWSPSSFTDKSFAVGDQFMQAPNSSYNDASCAAQSKAPRLSFQAHSAPLDSKFDSSNANLYVTFHGSWNRPTPTGFKLVVVPFSKGSDGSYAPTAAASSASGYTDVFTASDVTQCGTSNCARPVGLVFDANGQLYMTSDATGEGEIFLLGRS